MTFGMPNIFIADPLPQQQPAWGSQTRTQIVIENEEEKKKLFGIELAKDHPNPFEAAIAVFEDTGISLWASQNWLNDPLVIATRDLYLNTVGAKSKILDKDQLKARLLSVSEEKVHGRYIATPLERLKALELYAKISGFIDNKIDINNNTLIDNKMQIVLVKPQQKEEPKQIDLSSNLEDITSLSPISVKLVSNNKG